jgi:enoyl-CoA hydratase/carnithine racemase
MSDSTKKSSWPVPLPPSVRGEIRGQIAILTLARPEKRNALNEEAGRGMQLFFATLPKEIRGVVLHGEGDNFCAGLDLNELKEASAAEGIEASINGQRINDIIQYAKVPVIAVLHGAVIGAGLELAAAAHIRVAESTAYYALPEGMRGIFLGSGGSVRLPRLIGTQTVMDMMLTGRTLDVAEGHALKISQYLVEPGAGLAKAIALAERIATNAPLANFAIIQALPRIMEQDPSTGLFMETLMVSIAQADDEAKNRLRDFLDRKKNKVTRD